MKPELIQELVERDKLIERRIQALQIELDILNAERKLLKPLVELWLNQDYDSIEAEREVTENILNPEQTKKRKSKYFQYFDKIWTGANQFKPLTAKEIISELEPYVGRVTLSTIWSVLETATDAGYMTKIEGKPSPYIWNGIPTED